MAKAAYWTITDAEARKRGAVSYTHLDVYKRQVVGDAEGNDAGGTITGASTKVTVTSASSNNDSNRDVYKRQSL